MLLNAPKYYKEFKCTAQKCTHSCCIGWEIDIDCDTINRYASLSGEYADAIRASVEEGDLPHFRLREDERCPHLDDTGLCKIITEYGEGYLCDICRKHPRFYNETAHGLEVGLGMACEEACRIILSSDDYDKTAVIREDTDAIDIFENFDVIPHRKRIYSILKNNSLHFSDKLACICQLYSINPSTQTNSQWRSVLCSLEYLDNSHRELFTLYDSECAAGEVDGKLLERALAYFIYRHASSAWDEESLRARVGFSLFCVSLLASVIAHAEIQPVTAGRIISEEIEYSEENTEAITNIFKQTK